VTPGEDQHGGRPAAAAAPGLLVGRIGSVPVYLRASWFLIALVITALFAPTVTTAVGVGGGRAYLIAFSFAVLLLVSVLVHELAHAGVAAVTGTPATHIVLDLWGGHTAFGKESSAPWRSIAVSAAGPLSNLVLGVLAYSAIGSAVPGSVTRLLLVAGAYSNYVVAGINALPGLPLDGGRILEGLIWMATGDRITGTVVAGWCGRVVAAAGAGWAVYRLVPPGRDLTRGIWLLLIAAMLWQGAGRAIAIAGWQRRAGRVRTSDLLRRAVAVPSTATVAGALTAASKASADAVVVLDVYGRPASIVDQEAATQVPLGRTREVAASAVAQALPEGAVLPADLDGDPLIIALQASPAPRYVVVDGADQVIGVLDWEDVARFVART
jgi:Zn-dependent protease